jgi:hypothetical protein
MGHFLEISRRWRGDFGEEMNLSSTGQGSASPTHLPEAPEGACVRAQIADSLKTYFEMHPREILPLLKSRWILQLSFITHLHRAVHDFVKRLHAIATFDSFLRA